MAKVLLGWELGSNMGHITVLHQLALELRGAGHECVFAIRDVLSPGKLFEISEFPVFQAPFYHQPSRQAPGFQATSYADILGIRGFRDARELGALVAAWDRLLEAISPQLVIGDSAPTLCLAAYGRLPTILVGNGFTMPPANTPTFPAVGGGVTSMESQQPLLNAVQEVQRARGGVVPACLTECFAAADRFVTTVPELDPYFGSRGEPCDGPIDPPPPIVALPESPRFFAYLGIEHRRSAQILLDLAAAGLPGSVYLRGASAEINQQLRAAGLEVFDSPVDIDQILPRVTAFIHHGGTGLAVQALAASRPQVLLPLHLEQSLTTQRLHAAGVAGGFGEQAPTEQIRLAVKWAMYNQELAANCRSVAETVQQRRPFDALSKLTARCLERLRDEVRLGDRERTATEEKESTEERKEQERKEQERKEQERKEQERKEQERK